MLKLDNIIISRGQKCILKDLSLDIDISINTALVGPSGCGKSSLLKCLLGIIPADSGKIKFNDSIYQSEEVCLPIEDRDLGIVFQDLIIFDHMTVGDNILYGMNQKIEGQKKQDLDQLLKLFKLSEKIEQKASTLSGGEQQRLALARTLASKPQYLLLDEVFSSIDPLLRQTVRAEIKESLKELQKGSLLVTHDMDDVKEFADFVIILGDDGGVLQQGQLQAVMNNPANEIIAELFK